MAPSSFHTSVKIPPFEWNTGYKRNNMFLGSCFTEHIGNKMTASKYNTDVNPFGILYNPVSVANGINFLIQNKQFKKTELFCHNGLWHSFYHHGKFSSPDKEETLKRINSGLNASSSFLKNADFLFITFGTAWVYEHKKLGQIVSNCHKIPDIKFKRYKLTTEKITEIYLQLLNDLEKLNPEIKIIFTVSPVRHWKDGAIENQRSKATLLLSIEKIIDKKQAKNCAYFPAYEIVMDELRDYRFYSNDMIHISETAVNHIWNKFEDALIDKNSRRIAVLTQKITKAANHKPFNKFTHEHLLFLQKTLSKAEKMETEHPYLNFKLEKKYFIKQIDEIQKNINENSIK